MPSQELFSLFGREQFGMTRTQAKDLESRLAQDAFVLPSEYMPLIGYELDGEGEPAIFASKMDGTSLSVEPFTEKHLDAQGLMRANHRSCRCPQRDEGRGRLSRMPRQLQANDVEREAMDEGASPALVEGAL